jgi:hypothetical protein
MKHQIILLLALLCSATEATAQFSYATNASTLTVTDYTGPGGLVSIPETAFGLPVVAIGPGAFFRSTTLTQVQLPNNLLNIAAQAFAGCSSLSTVTIPEGVTNIGESAFGSCFSLTAISVNKSNTFYSSQDGVLFDHAMTAVLQYPSGLAGDYSIPSGVISIESNAFQNCLQLSSVTIPPSVTNIATQAFEGCSGLTGIQIPSSVTAIGDGAFENCPNLTSLTLPFGVTSIGFQSFASSGLTNLTLPDSVTNIGQQAFQGCLKLNQVSIPASVNSIGQRAFALCAGLLSIDVDPANSFFSSIGGVLFDRHQTALLQYPGALTGAYTIPATVTNIAPFAFAWCDGLTSLVVPQNVAVLGDGAFFNSPSLATLDFQGNAPTVGSSEFSGDNNVTIVYSPGTTGWSNTFAGQPAAPQTTPVNPGSLQVSISPASAIAAGARWQVDAGAWQASGVTVSNLSAGRHVITFNTVPGWIPPNPPTVTIRAKTTNKTKGSYSFAARGTYNGLFYTDTAVSLSSAGMVKNLTIGPVATYSARLLLPGASYAFSGSFNYLGRATNRIQRPAKLGGPIVIALTANWTNSPMEITGSISANAWTASVTNVLAASHIDSAEYTMITVPLNDPPGSGYLLVTNHAGNVAISGALADGTAFSQNVPVSFSGDLPLYASLYNNSGAVLGWLNLSANPPSGNVAWIKKASPSVRYPAGFTNILSLQGSRWIAPPPNTPAFDLAAGSLEIAGGNLPSPLNFSVALADNNSVAKLFGIPTNSLNGSVNRKTGLLTLTFGNGLGKAVTSAKGVVLQGQTNGAGFFLGKTNAGSFLLQP